MIRLVARRALLPLGVVALDLADLFVSRSVAFGLACCAVVLSFAWLVYVLNAYGFPWPWRRS